MLTIEALRALYVKMGGNAADVADLELTPDIIEAIKDIYEDKGDTLPAVTSDDNGKALLVQEGAWDKGPLPSDTFMVTYTPDGQGGVTCDKTYAQIIAAHREGKELKAKLTLPNESGGALLGYSKQYAFELDEHDEIEAIIFAFVASYNVSYPLILNSILVAHGSDDIGYSVGTGSLAELN